MADVRSKFLAAAAGVLPDDAAAMALSRLERIDELPSIDGALVGALAGTQPMPGAIRPVARAGQADGSFSGTWYSCRLRSPRTAPSTWPASAR